MVAHTDDRTFGLGGAPSAVKPTTRSDAAENRVAILRAVRDLAATKGDAFSIKEVSEAAGIATATIYRHFDGKAALLDGVSLFRWSQMKAAATGVAGQPDGLRHAVSIIDAYTRMTTADSGFIAALNLRVGRDPAGIGPLRNEFDPAFAAIWRTGQQRGEIRRGADPHDAIELAGAIRESSRRLQMLALLVAGIATPAIEPEQLVRDLFLTRK